MADKIVIPDDSTTGSDEDKTICKLLTEMDASGQDGPFYLIRIEQLVKQYQEWTKHMPRVHPYYAVKCNTNDPIVRTLIRLGCGLDVASEAEIHQAIDSLKMSPNRLVFANTCKRVSHLLYAKEKGLTLTIFETELELLKIQQHFPEIRLMIRIRCINTANSALPMGRFGCSVEEAERLMDRCRELKLNLRGIHFHVGMRCEPGIYVTAIKNAKMLFDYAAKNGNTLKILDIGGGFPGCVGEFKQPLTKYWSAINAALDQHFPTESGVELMAEPGQFFAAAAQSLFTNVIGIKTDPVSGNAVYTLTDGLYGSFGLLHQFGAIPEIRIHGLTVEQASQEAKACALVGPTCNPLDRITEACHMPDLKLGQWLEFKCMGAYSNVALSTFNGFPMPSSVVLVPRRYLHLIQIDD